MKLTKEDELSISALSDAIASIDNALDCLDRSEMRNARCVKKFEDACGTLAKEIEAYFVSQL